jgi:hypothetical protein
MFLLGYAVSLYRFQSLAWATIVASLALGITVGAGMLLTTFIRLQPQEPQQIAPVTPTAKGRAVDFTLASDGPDDEATQVAQPWQTEMAS